MGLAGRAEQGMGQTAFAVVTPCPVMLASGGAVGSPGPDAQCDPTWPQGTVRWEVSAGGDADPRDLQG